MYMSPQENKAIVTRVNKEFIEGGNVNTVYEIFAPDFVNQTAPPGSPQGPEAIIYFFNHLLKPAFPDLKVEIHDQVAEGDKVTTRKSFYATHTGEFFGIPATQKPVVMDVIDIVRLRDGKYVEHWGILDMQSLMAQLSN
jgi:predicted ester cyclase